MNYQAFEKTASEHQCNVSLQSWRKQNKSFVSLSSKTYPGHASTGASSTQKCRNYFKRIFRLLKLGTFSASTVDKQHSRGAGWGTQGTVITGCCATPLEQSMTKQIDGHEGITHTGDTQLTEKAQGGYCSNLTLREAMRHPKLLFQNLLPQLLEGYGSMTLD